MKSWLQEYGEKIHLEKDVEGKRRREELMVLWEEEFD